MTDNKSKKDYRNTSLFLLGKRLGFNYNSFDKESKQDVRNDNLGVFGARVGLNYQQNLSNAEDSESTIDSIVDPNVTGVNNQRAILGYNGGTSQQDRMIFDKRRTLDRVLKYSYQSTPIRKVQCDDDLDNTLYPNIHALDEHPFCWALINPDKNKMNYDDKIISVHYEENYHPGDVFEWIGTNTYWLIYLQDLDEKAYFRGEIRRCSYQITWEDENGQHTSYAAIRGPVETKIDYIQKHQISVDNPNHSLNILMPRTKDTVSYFQRYSKFYLQDETEGAPLICWRVEAVDWISTPGILEINATEYYSNKDEDDLENKIAGALIAAPIDPNPEPDEDQPQITGDTFIKPKVVYEYRYEGTEGDSYSWKIDVKNNNTPELISMRVNPNDPYHIKLIWNSSFSGQFILSYGPTTKTIVVESLF